MPPTLEWYYDGVCDIIVVMTTTKAYTLLHLGRLVTAAEVPPTLVPVALSEFLQPPPALVEYQLMLKFEPIPKPKTLPVYEPLSKFEHMSPDLPFLELIILKVPAIDICSSDSPIAALEPFPASDSFESDPSEVMFTTTSRVSRHSFGHGRTSRPRWIRTLIIPCGRGHRGHGF